MFILKTNHKIIIKFHVKVWNKEVKKIVLE